MFRALPAHPQKALNMRNLVYWVCVMSVGYIILTLVQPNNITRTHVSNAASAVMNKQCSKQEEAINF
jgi:hypothetical protein